MKGSVFVAHKDIRQNNKNGDYGGGNGEQST